LFSFWVFEKNHERIHRRRSNRGNRKRFREGGGDDTTKRRVRGGEPNTHDFETLCAAGSHHESKEQRNDDVQLSNPATCKIFWPWWAAAAAAMLDE
jgi:hypothetical protein